MNNIGKSKVINIIVKSLHINSGKVTPSTPLTNRLQMDELDIQQICEEIEKEFGVYIYDKEPGKFYKVNDFINAIDESIEPYIKQ